MKVVRLIRNSLFGVTLLLAAIFIAGAVRSFFSYDRFERDVLTDLGGPWKRAWTRLDSNAGRIDLWILRETRTSRGQYDSLVPMAAAFRYYSRGGKHTMPTDSRWMRFLGIYGEVERREGHFFTRVIVPYWLVVLGLLIWPIWRVYRRVRPPVGKAGACVGCGYDLRASSGRCPECGLGIDGGLTEG